MAETENSDLTQLTVQLLSAYLANNVVAREDLADLIASTRTALSGEVAPPAPVEPEFVPAVSVRKSLSSPDHLLSMIDGKPYKMLKRHLASNGLTPAEYRERYNLARDYPMVAKTYSEARRATAARIGLGTRVATKSPAEIPTTSDGTNSPLAAPAQTSAEPVVKSSRAPRKKSDAPATATSAKAAPAEDKRGSRKAGKLTIATPQEDGPSTVSLAVPKKSAPEAVAAPSPKAVKSVPAKAARRTPATKKVQAPPVGEKSAKESAPTKRAGRPKKVKVSVEG